MSDQEHIALGAALDLDDLMPEVAGGMEGGAGGPTMPAGVGGDGAPQVGGGLPGLDAEPPHLAGQGGPRFKRRGAELMAHARASRAAKRAKTTEEGLRKKVAEQQEALDTVIRSVPVAGKLLGKASSSTAVGRKKKNLKASDLRVVCRGMHLPSKAGANLGVKQKRLICAGAKFVLLRARYGLKSLLHNSGQVLGPEGERDKVVHMSYTHMWDEVNTKFRSSKKSKSRVTRMSTDIQTIVQKGALLVALADLQKNKYGRFVEQWLCQPKKVSGTSAEAIFPAVMEAQPENFRLDCPDNLAQTSQKVTSLTLSFVGDAASSNISIMKRLGLTWEDGLPLGSAPHVLVMFDTCGIHLHHRAKLQVLPLRRHTTRHFSIAHLMRLQPVQGHMMKRLESMLTRRVQRSVGNPPENMRGNLKSFVDILFKPSASFHKRAGKGGVSQQVQDLRALCEMVNGDLCDSQWTHWCWDPTTRQPCCESHEDCVEKTMVAVTNSLFGAADPIPAESRWTHTLANFKKTLLRKAVYGVGLSSFPTNTEPIPEEALADDDASLAAFLKMLKAKRIARTTEYYGSDRNLHELAVLAMILEIIDSNMLYPLLGDATVPEDTPSKVDKVMDKQSSLLGTCQAQLSELMGGWTGPPDRVPWSILDVLQAPMQEQSFLAFARAQILRMASSVARRYEVRFSTWPYSLWPLTSDDATHAERTEIAEALLRAPREELDTYSFGLRRRHNSVESILSKECRLTLSTDFRNFAYGVDTIERLNAEVTSLHPRRAPGRNFTNAARESVLRHASALHRSRGGDDPLKPQGIMPTSRQQVVTACRLLPPLTAFDSAPGPPLAAIADAPSPMPPPVAGDQGSARNDIVALVPYGGERSGERSGEPAEWFGEELVELRASSVVQASTTDKPDKESSGKRGLSPYLLQQNSYIKSVKTLKGRTLTEEELVQARAAFRAIWNRIDDKSGFVEQYDNWRSSGSSSQELEKKAYQTTFGGGCLESPVACEEFFQYLSWQGWPKDEEVLDSGNTEGEVAPGPASAFLSSVKYSVWGIKRAAKNVNRSTVLSRVQFDLVERGLLNFLHTQGRESSDSGQLMFMVEGTPKLQANGAPKRVVMIVSGTTYRPLVFDCARCKFEAAADSVADALPLPCIVALMTRPSKVASNFAAMDILTSDDLVLHLTTHFMDMRLSKLEYEVIVDESGSIKCSKVIGKQEIGTLWLDSMTKAMLSREVAASAKRGSDASPLDQLIAGDPFSAEPASRGRGRASARRGRGAGRGRAGRGAARGSADARVDVAMAEAIADADDAGGGLDEAGGDANDDLAVEPEIGPENLREGLDLAELENESLAGSDKDEFDATYPRDEEVVAPMVGDDDFPVPDTMAAEADPATIQSMIESIAENVDGGADDDIFGDFAAASSASASVGPAPSGERREEDAPWLRLGAPSATGYVYDGVRSVMRIQRGKPFGSATVSCYRHPNCRLLLAASRCPDDDELKRWLFEVEPADAEAPSSERKALAKRHMDLGRGRWFANRRP